ncbi:hypothetical protein D3C77_397650 [compost metagenome]
MYVYYTESNGSEVVLNLYEIGPNEDFAAVVVRPGTTVYIKVVGHTVYDFGDIKSYTLTKNITYQNTSYLAPNRVLFSCPRSRSGGYFGLGERNGFAATVGLSGDQRRHTWLDWSVAPVQSGQKVLGCKLRSSMSGHYEEITRRSDEP